MTFNIQDFKSCYQIKDNSFFISLLIQPNSKKTEIQGLHDNKLKVRIHSPPVDGKANEEVIRFFSKLLKIKKNQIDIVKGHTDKTKLLQISDISEALLIEKITALVLNQETS